MEVKFNKMDERLNQREKARDEQLNQLAKTIKEIKSRKSTELVITF